MRLISVRTVAPSHKSSYSHGGDSNSVKLPELYWKNRIFKYLSI